MGAGLSQHLCILLGFTCPYPLSSVNLILKYAVHSLLLVAHLRTRPDRLDSIIQARLFVIAHKTVVDCDLTVLFVLLVQLDWGLRSQKLLHERGV